MNILAIDQGSTSTKALVIGADGQILGAGNVPVHPVPVDQGGVEQDPNELWRSVVDAGRMAVGAAGVPIDAVGLANQGETVLAWDPGSGRPLSMALSWQDRRADALVREIAIRAGELAAITGLPVDPYFAAPKMAWLRRHRTSQGVVTTTDSWLIYRLTGAFATDASTASRTGLLDIQTVDWSSVALEAFGLSNETLPSIAPSAGPIGVTTAFGHEVPLTAFAVDQQAALFGQGAHAPGDTKCTFGTGAFVLTNIGASPTPSDSGLALSVAWRLADQTTYCLDGQVYTAGAAVSWLREIGMISGVQDLDHEIGPSGDLGPVFIPALAGLGAPFWEPAARGAFTGLSLHTTRSQLVHSVVEGIAASVALVVRKAESDLGRTLPRLRVDGGLTKSRALMQVQADLIQVPVEVFPNSNATAFGIAALARHGMGDRNGAVALATNWHPSATFEPSVTPDEALDRIERWKTVASAIVHLEKCVPAEVAP
jgi:glycerol kinase